jgi:geranylgeranyl diphosphate synthase type I
VPAGVALDALAQLDYTCLALTQGQHLDMAFEQRQTVTVAEYMAMIEKKTAALIAAATYLGARLAGAGPERLAHYEAFGLNLGLAFQLRDDLLGIWGDPAVTGKSAASDLQTRKKSLPVVFGLEHSAEFAAAYARPAEPGEDVTGLARRLEALGARDHVERHVAAATERAHHALDAAGPAGPAADALRTLTGQLLARQQ